MRQPLLTAIVSTYAAERFIRGCLADLLAQTAIDDIEVIVIDSGSPERESAICAEFANGCPQIKLIRTEREPLYAAWNRALTIARGKYITNANTDDRHRRDFAERMTTLLDRHPDIALAYADQYISEVENETFEECERRDVRRRRWPDFTPEDLMLRCITGSQPVWRKSLHDEFGSFDTRYRIAADYDMWLRIASRYAFLHVAEPLGVLYESPNTLAGANNRLNMNLESLEIKKAHMKNERWCALPELRRRLAAELYGTGCQHLARDRDSRAARPFIKEAIRLDPTNLDFIKTYLFRCVAGIV